MSLARLGGAMAYGCTHCAAVLLAHDHVARVRAGLDKAAAGVAEHAAQGRPKIPPALDGGPLFCPLCRVAMQPAYLDGQRVRIDVCARDGVFFDAHEVIEIAPKSDFWAVRAGDARIGRGMGNAALEVLGVLFFGNG